MEETNEISKIRDYRNTKVFLMNDDFVDTYAKLCGVNATLVYFCLCRYADKDQKCFPSINLISEKLGISTRSVIRAILRLISFNIISKERIRRKNATWLNNTYTLLDKRVWKKEPCAPQSLGLAKCQIRQSHVTHSHTKVLSKKELSISEILKKESLQSTSLASPPVGGSPPPSKGRESSGSAVQKGSAKQHGSAKNKTKSMYDDETIIDGDSGEEITLPKGKYSIDQRKGFDDFISTWKKMWSYATTKPLDLNIKVKNAAMKMYAQATKMYTHEEIMRMLQWYMEYDDFVKQKDMYSLYHFFSTKNLHMTYPKITI